MGDLDDIDFFKGNELVADPYPYYDHLRQKCPVVREPNHGVVMVTGYEEAVRSIRTPPPSRRATRSPGPSPASLSRSWVTMSAP